MRTRQIERFRSCTAAAVVAPLLLLAAGCNAPPEGVAFSPDGTRFAAATVLDPERGTYEFCVFPTRGPDSPDGGAIFVDQGMGAGCAPSWLRDGRSLAYLVVVTPPTKEQPTVTYELRVWDGAAVRALTTLRAGECEAARGVLVVPPQPTADGMALLVTEAEDAARAAVLRVSLEDGAREVLVPGGFAPVLSPDGTRLAVQVRRAGRIALVLCDASAPAPIDVAAATTVADDTWPGYVAWSSDGSLLAYLSAPLRLLAAQAEDDAHVHVFAPEDGTDRVVGDPDAAFAGRLVFSPDGTTLWYGTEGGAAPDAGFSTWRVDLATGAATLEPGARDAVPVAVSPDGGTLALRVGLGPKNAFTDVWTLDLATGEPSERTYTPAALLAAVRAWHEYAHERRGKGDELGALRADEAAASALFRAERDGRPDPTARDRARLVGAWEGVNAVGATPVVLVLRDDGSAALHEFEGMETNGEFDGRRIALADEGPYDVVLAGTSLTLTNPRGVVRLLRRVPGLAAGDGLLGVWRHDDDERGDAWYRFHAGGRVERRRWPLRSSPSRGAFEATPNGVRVTLGTTTDAYVLDGDLLRRADDPTATPFRRLDATPWFAPWLGEAAR